MPAIDLTGERFGMLTVIGRAPTVRRHGAIWSCVCDCGASKDVRGQHLRNGSTSSCGCIRGKNMMKPSGVAAANTVLTNYKQSAKNRGLSWNLTDDQAFLLMGQDCSYCGTSPSNTRKVQGLNGDYTYNGIDRLDNTQGYSLDNCGTACANCNFAKRDLTPDEFRDWINRLIEFNSQPKTMEAA